MLTPYRLVAFKITSSLCEVIIYCPFSIYFFNNHAQVFLNFFYQAQHQFHQEDKMDMALIPESQKSAIKQQEFALHQIEKRHQNIFRVLSLKYTLLHLQKALFVFNFKRNLPFVFNSAKFLENISLKELNVFRKVFFFLRSISFITFKIPAFSLSIIFIFSFIESYSFFIESYTSSERRLTEPMKENFLCFANRSSMVLGLSLLFQFHEIYCSSIFRFSNSALNFASSIFKLFISCSIFVSFILMLR